MDYVINLVGEDAVGIGTDFTQNYDQPFFDWITHDKGFGRRLTKFGEIVNPEGCATSGTFQTSPMLWRSQAGTPHALKRCWARIGSTCSVRFGRRRPHVQAGGYQKAAMCRRR